MVHGSIVQSLIVIVPLQWALSVLNSIFEFFASGKISDSNLKLLSANVIDRIGQVLLIRTQLKET